MPRRRTSIIKGPSKEQGDALAAKVQETVATLQEGEDLAAKGATAPRVSLELLNSRVVHEYYVNGATAFAQNYGLKGHPDLGTMTLCMLVLDNGWKLFGTSSSASPENFDEKKGKAFARQDALRKLWELEGYLLKDRLWREEQDRLIEQWKLESAQRTREEDGDV